MSSSGDSCLHPSDNDSDHPDLQEKVRRCVNQGFIDLEDFNGVCLRSYSSLYDNQRSM